MPKPKSYAAKVGLEAIDFPMTTSEVAELLDLTQRRINQLVAEGHLTKHGRDRFQFVEVVHQHIDYLRHVWRPHHG